MKNNTLAVLLSVCALTLTARADEATVKITDVHMCCKGCAGAAQKAVAQVKDVHATADPDSDTITITGPDKAAVQKATDAVVAAGFFGKSSDPEIKLRSDSGAKGKTVQTLKLQGTHLCCGECVSTVNKAVNSVPGVKAHTAAKNAKTFEVTGEFNDKELVEALQKAGLNATVAK